MAASPVDAPALATPIVETKPSEVSELSKEYDAPIGIAHTTMQALKDRIKKHYDLASDYYLNLWGEHIHHGYWATEQSKATDSKEEAQINLIRLLLDISQLAPGSHVLDVGCGIGGTSRFLASQLGCTVTGITISGKQVEMATRLTKTEATKESSIIGSSSKPNNTSNDVVAEDADGFIRLGKGMVRFVELDAEKLGESSSNPAVFGNTAIGSKFDAVWISEALSHFPNKALFFRNAQSMLREGGKLVLADWFKAEGLDQSKFDADIKPIEDGMLLPPLCTQPEYVQLAKDAGLKVLSAPKDISQEVAKTWDISWTLVQKPALWAFAGGQGRDGIAFLQAFRAMRRGYADGSFRYAVMAFEK
ncbi:S-adenosyl-L-methionine-dependent methyltransferase [Bombardia bombarda]|uniref:S-adenosyl-L-methionine-dependent methyltransferase n=1 Tax=Bombardia bombarda TaxID=252184 RepID=A0AA39XLF9_9PEZI|nr:S-adenosyl-L-methionine-dependent methyltransferase [Bombardia bombarda]